MQQTEIETAFAELVENITGTQPARIDRDLNLDKLGLDSLSKIDLAVAAEDRFGIAIRMKIWNVSWSSATFWITSIVPQREISQDETSYQTSDATTRCAAFQS
jgi:acyl carrier protein